MMTFKPNMRWLKDSDSCGQTGPGGGGFKKGSAPSGVMEFINEQKLQKLSENLWIGVRTAKGWGLEKATAEDVRGLLSLMVGMCPSETFERAFKLVWGIKKRASEMDGAAEFKINDKRDKITFYIFKNVQLDAGMIVYKAMIANGGLRPDPVWFNSGSEPFYGLIFGDAQYAPSRANLIIVDKRGKPINDKKSMMLQRTFSKFFDKKVAEDFIAKIVEIAETEGLRLKHTYLHYEGVVTGILFADAHGKSGSVCVSTERIQGTGVFKTLHFRG